MLLGLGLLVKVLEEVWDSGKAQLLAGVWGVVMECVLGDELASLWVWVTGKEWAGGWE